MTETAKVRIVRCPKCENLLPEVLHYSVYQCGGCGAVLSAKDSGIDLETFSEKLDVEMVRETIVEHFNRNTKNDMAEKSIAVSSDDSESNVSSISTLSQTKMGILSCKADNGSSLMNKEEIETNENFHGPKIPQDLEDSRILKDNGNFRGSGRFVDGVITYGKEAPLNLQCRSSFDENLIRNMSNTCGYNSTGYDRIELIRKLDELTDKLNRSGNLIEKNVPLDHLSFKQDHHVSENWYHNSSRQPPYQNRYSGSSPFGHRDEMISNGFHPFNRIEYGDSRSHSLGRGLYETHAPYQQHIYKYGPNMDDRRGTNSLAIHNQHNSFLSRENYNDRITDPFSRYQNFMRLPSHTNSEADGFSCRRPTRVHLVSNSKKHRPYTGGAPFFTCCNCFELLLLPNILQKYNRKKLRCGSCSMVLILEVSDKSIVFSSDVDARDVVVKIGDPHHYILDRVGSGSFNTHSARVLKKEMMASSSFYSNYDFQPMNRFEEGNISGRSTHEKDSVKKANAPQILMKDSSETEMNLSSSECFTTGMTFHSGEGSRESDRQKGSNVIESFFTGIMKKNFSKTNQNEEGEEEKANVTVNGYPVQDRLIKKAEKLAGPIHPGSYWYDFRAGFWGAMGGPCLGIIPPFIEELNYPMPEKCSGGNTHVYINRRELNQKDLNLLASRGLPTESNRSYFVEISGRVLDEDTGEELEGLGKLAPTVEKSKHGFGMRNPTAVVAR